MFVDACSGFRVACRTLAKINNTMLVIQIGAIQAVSREAYFTAIEGGDENI